LGLVLLEVGLWRTVASLASTMQSDDQSPEALGEFLLAKYVPRLGSSMGLIYQEVVRKCLKSEFGHESDSIADENAASLLLSFEECVVARLRTCCA
jgi:hypothetical protein